MIYRKRRKISKVLKPILQKEPNFSPMLSKDPKRSHRLVFMFAHEGCFSFIPSQNQYFLMTMCTKHEEATGSKANIGNA